MGMNERQYSKLIEGYRKGKQVDFNVLYDVLTEYAESKARGLPDDAAYEAVSKVCDLIAEGRLPHSWAYTKEIIDNTLIDIRRKQGTGQRPAEFDVSLRDIGGSRRHQEAGFVDVYTGEFDEEAGEDTEDQQATWGWRGCWIADNHGYPKIEFLRLPDGKERDICKLYWIEGKEQHEIAKELRVHKSYVSRVVRKYKREAQHSDRL